MIRKLGALVLLVMGMVLVGREKVRGTTAERAKTIRGIVLPHHDLARQIILQAGERLTREADPEYIIVMSPNHFRPQSYTFSTSLKLKDFAMAVEKIRSIKEFDTNLVLDEGLMESEHGVGIPMTYLRQFFPGAKFVPLAISPYFYPQALEKMAQFLTEIFPEKTLYVASVDFSHEKMALEAARKNQETVGIIKNFEYRQLWGLGDDHLDSPAAAGVLLMIAEKLGAKTWETWYDTHGAMLIDEPLLQGTSYVIGVFR